MIGPLAAAGFEHPQDCWDRQRHGGGFVALADHMVNAVAGQGLGVVLDSHGGGLGGTEGVDAEQVSQRAAVDADGLSDLEEPDQLQAVQALGAGLVAIDLRRPRVDGWVGGDQAVDVANRKKPRTACIAVFTEESISPDSPRWRMSSSM